MLWLNLILAVPLIVATVIMHFTGLVGLSWVLRRRSEKDPKRLGSIIWQGGIIVFVVTGLFAIHTAQIWLYALTFIALGEFATLEAALYFSTSTFTTVGFGDITLDEKWRLLAAIESANGFLMIGWSTAFLVSLTNRIRAIEADLEGAEGL